VNLNQYLRSLPDNRLLPVARAFNQFLQLANIAEQHHRIYSKGHDDDNSRSAIHQMKLYDVFKRVENERKDAKRLILDTLTNMRIELVLTAHPTETIRRTLIKKYDLIEECLGVLDMCNPKTEEKFISKTSEQTKERLEGLISQAWHTNEFRREKPSPVDGSFFPKANIIKIFDYRSQMGFCGCGKFPLGSCANILP
jgi:phosphoenolpyruvate carboxylase